MGQKPLLRRVVTMVRFAADNRLDDACEALLGSFARSTHRRWQNDIPALLDSLLDTNCCKQVQEDEEIQKGIDFSSIKPKMKSRR